MISVELAESMRKCDELQAENERLQARDIELTRVLNEQGMLLHNERLEVGRLRAFVQRVAQAYSTDEWIATESHQLLGRDNCG